MSNMEMPPQSDFLKTLENWAKLYFFQSLTEFFNNLKHADLSILQAYALTYLFYKGPIKITELCEHLKVSPAAASQLVDRLEKLNLVSRTPDPNDRRVRIIIMAEKGIEFVQENFSHSQSWLSNIPADISLEQQSQIEMILSTLIQQSGKTKP